MQRFPKIWIPATEKIKQTMRRRAKRLRYIFMDLTMERSTICISATVTELLESCVPWSTFRTHLVCAPQHHLLT